MRGGEQWRDIPGMGGWYQASTLGQIRTWHRLDGRGRREVPYTMKINGRGIVSLRPADMDRPKIYGVGYLVYITWNGPVPPGKRVIHRSLDTADNRPENLILGTRKTQARRMNAKKPGSHNRRPVVKMDTSLEVIEVYPSARQAEIKNHFGESTLTGYCNMERLSVIAGDGFIYAWDDDAWMRKTLRRAAAELEAMGIRFTAPATEEYYNLPIDPAEAIDPEALTWADTFPIPGGGGHYFRALTA